MMPTVLPPGPRTPRPVQQLQWIADPFGYLDRAAARFGHCFSTKIAAGGNVPFVMCSDPSAIQEIFALGPDRSLSGRINAFLSDFFGDNSILLLDGAPHKRARKLLMPPFHGERMRAYGNLICQIARDVYSQLNAGDRVIARQLMQTITLRVIIRAVFGLSDERAETELLQWLDINRSPAGAAIVFLRFLRQDLGAWSPWGQFVRRRERTRSMLQVEIDARRQHGDFSGDDILTMLLQARDEEGMPLDDVEIVDELLTLLVAGHETTATALAWACYWVHRDPSVRTQLLDELKALGPDPDPSAIARAPYLSAVCNEALRIYPVVPIAVPRILTQAATIGDREYPNGSILVPCIYLAHRNPDLYPDPERFCPERFLDRQYGPGEFLPFGGGSRRCIGYALALTEMKLVLAMLMLHVNFELAEPEPVLPSRRGVTLAPATGVRMTVLSPTSDRAVAAVTS
ncbi:cytochrome P450 [Rubidibacter lacunae KORDI 51-2]|uniref:Cytochrome P450 n=1 Tax=Rubidibacter lacunae KORDI 51-2 TaxID=582515 RepID=U5D8X6_9CHRO|nr:cytochrome P450 [Rubidibacter lacunae]ERN41048.1 cytochrome P450 [Rubidibacter lacunae KORDI 51-2]